MPGRPISKPNPRCDAIASPIASQVLQPERAPLESRIAAGFAGWSRVRIIDRGDPLFTPPPVWRYAPARPSANTPVRAGAMTMPTHTVRVHPSADRLPRERQLAWSIAAFAAAPGPIEPDVAAMAGLRLAD